MRNVGRFACTAVGFLMCGVVAPAQVLLLEDRWQLHASPQPDNYQVEVTASSSAVLASRPQAGAHVDLEAFTDGQFLVSIDRSSLTGDRVQFLVLDGTTWAGPPNRGAQVSGAAGFYVIEAEIALELHSAGGSWIGEMTATDGGPVLDVGPPGSWEGLHVGYPSVRWTGSGFEMWYSGSTDPPVYPVWPTDIGYATSSDGVIWTKWSANPVLPRGPFGSFDWANALMPSVNHDGNEYEMWYAGRSSVDDLLTTKIGRASSVDAVSWVKDAGSPVLTNGPSSSFDNVEVMEPSVISGMGLFRMWYTGTRAGNWAIGLATSGDGITWSRQSDSPVLDAGVPGEWDSEDVFGGSVLSVSGSYRMWYSGSSWSTLFQIGVADSADGITWTRNPANPVLSGGKPASWEDCGVWCPAVVYDGTAYRMWYTGSSTDGHFRIGYATSPDGVHWTKFQLPEVVDAFQVTGVTEGDDCEVSLTVPATADLDLFVLQGTGGPDDVLGSSCTRAAGTPEYVQFAAPRTGVYVVVVTNEDGGTGLYSVSFLAEPPVRLYRGAVSSLAAGWRPSSLPLTETNDNEAPPFPVRVTPPGTFTDSLPSTEPLVLYRVLKSGVTPLGNSLRATGEPGAIQVSF